MKCFDYRRREVLKTTAVVCGVALGLGAIGVPFFLKKGSPPAELLLSPEIAKADPELFRQVCLLYHRHPDDRVRSACVSYLGGFDDAAVRAALWEAAEADRTVGVRGEATAALVSHDRREDRDRLARLYHADPDVRSVMDTLVAVLELAELRAAIRAR